MISGIATIRVQVRIVGMVKNMADSGMTAGRGPAPRPGSVERAVDLFGQFPGNAFDAGDVVHTRRGNAAYAAKALQQARALLGANAGNVLELAAADPHPCATRAHPRDGKAMGLIANLRH